jgi:DNA ligase (NAD+)
MNKVQYLVNQIIYHKKLYYSGNAKIPDYAYDRLEDELKKLEPNHPVLELVGYDPNYEKYVKKE